jgi:hypothetical protein
VLLADESNGNDPTLTRRHRVAEYPFSEKNALGVMSKRPMPKVRKESLRFIEPMMDVDEIVWITAVFLG